MALPVNKTVAMLDFQVISDEDLFLEGQSGRLLRVSKGFVYSCQMSRTQPMSCLFKHYAKHHGLRQQDLKFTFVDEVQSDSTPETIHLMPNDRITVCQKSNEENFKHQLNSSKETWTQNMLRLLRSPCHADLTFIVGKDRMRITCHKAIICARSEYFSNMFQPGGLYESRQSEIIISNYNPKSFVYMLEYLYTGEFSLLKISISSVQDIRLADLDDLVELVMIADEYQLDFLKRFAGKYCCKCIKEDNIVSLIVLALKHTVGNLQDACVQFMRLHKTALKKNPKFLTEIETAPEVGLLLFSALPSFDTDQAGDDPANPSKRPRIL